MFALIRNGSCVKTGPSEAALLSSRLSMDEAVLPLVDAPVAAGVMVLNGEPDDYSVADGVVTRIRPTRALTPDEAQEAFREKRRSAYPAISDQLDAIMKGLAALQAGGVTLAPAAAAWIAACEGVKARIPKPTP